MKLDTPLDVKGPYSLKGTVDVYFSNGQWIARSWPKRPQQPNSTAQISAREKFAAMLDLRASLPEPEKKFWREAIWPPGKTWDDAWRSNILKYFHYYDTTTFFRTLQSFPIFSTCLSMPGNPPGEQYAVGWSRDVPGEFFYQLVPSQRYLLRPDLSGVKWEVNGMLCYAGKKAVPHYFPTFPKNNLTWGVQHEYDGSVFLGFYAPAPAPFAISYVFFPDNPRWDIPGYIMYYPEVRVTKFERYLTI